MTQNPPSLRPDLAPAAKLPDALRPGQPRIGMVSLGCPKALVDSERILTRLRAEGYGISPDYTGADAERDLQRDGMDAFPLRSRALSNDAHVKKQIRHVAVA